MPRAFAHGCGGGAIAAIAVAWLAVLGVGCSGYEKTVQPIRQSLERGNLGAALLAVNKQLGVKGPRDLPKKFEADTALLLLERAMILQAMGRMEDSSFNFEIADKHLELLDLSKDTAGNIGKYLYSDDATNYKAPVYEKLLLSTENMVNYLVRGDLNGARIESRRLAIMQQYLRNQVGPDKAKFGLGSYLAGFAFEKSGRAEEALRFYDEALAAQPYPSLDAPIARLLPTVGLRTPALQQAAERGASRAKASEDSGELLVVMQSGLVPRKQPERFPIGLIFSYTVALMSPAESATAQRLIAKGLLKWINFPVLKKQKPRAWPDAVTLGAGAITVEPALDVTARVEEAYEAMKPKLMLAAITRMITRAVAAEVTEAGVKGAGGGGIFGLLAGMAVEGAMTAKDTPDTRSWTTLPGTVALARGRVPAGKHEVRVQFGSVWGPIVHRVAVDVPAGGFRVVSFFEPR